MSSCSKCGINCTCLKGDRGPRGFTGLKGDTGDKGDTGIQGPQGSQGLPGQNGLSGDKGNTGNTGNAGVKGDKGDPGPAGANGVDGTNGLDGAVGATGPQGLQGDSGVNGNYVTQTVIYAGATCPCGGNKYDLKNGTTNAILSTATICTPCVFDAMVAQSQPASLLKTAPGLNTSRITDGTIQLITEISDPDNAYDPLTGIWTCPVDGIYDLNFFINYSIETGDGFFDGSTPGMFGAGIVTPTTPNNYCSQWMSPIIIQKHLNIAGTSLARSISAGTQLCLKVMNATAYDYVSETGDVVRLVIKRIK